MPRGAGKPRGAAAGAAADDMPIARRQTDDRQHDDRSSNEKVALGKSAQSVKETIAQVKLYPAEPSPAWAVRRPAPRLALRKSAFIRAMNRTLMPLGQAASHSS